MLVNDESEKVGLKFNIQKTMIGHFEGWPVLVGQGAGCLLPTACFLLDL